MYIDCKANYAKRPQKFTLQVYFCTAHLQQPAQKFTTSRVLEFGLYSPVNI